MAWAGAIAVASSRPDLPSAFPFDVPFADKVAHVGLYCVLGILLRWAGVGATWVLVACIAWGVNDEVHQSFVPGRDASVGDLVADAVGATIAVWTASWVGRRVGLHAGDASGDDGVVTRGSP